MSEGRMWCAVETSKILCIWANTHGLSPSAMRFCVAKSHTTSVSLRSTASPQGEALTPTMPSVCSINRWRIYPLRLFEAPLPKGEARACAEPANSSLNRNLLHRCDMGTGPLLHLEIKGNASPCQRCNIGPVPVSHLQTARQIGIWRWTIPVGSFSIFRFQFSICVSIPR